MSDRVCWIETVPTDQADNLLKQIYDTVKRDDGTVHHLYQAFSSFPQATLSADSLYRDIMHSSDAPLPMWLTELISIQVADLARCTYAFAHHSANFLYLYREAGYTDGKAVVDGLQAGDWSSAPFDQRMRAILDFGNKLTLRPHDITRLDIEALHDAGLNDAEISQVVQVAANFAYWVRVINAFGIQLGNEKVGKYGHTRVT